MRRVGEHPVPVGPLAVRWHAWQLEPMRAGSLAYADVVLENAGSVPWRGIELSYHWLDDLGNVFVIGERWTPLAREVAPGETIEQRAELRGPLGVGSYRLAFDLVEDGRHWFGELGNTRLEVDVDVAPRIERRALAVVFTPGPSELVTESRQALAQQDEPLVEQGEETALAHLVPGAVPLTADWSARILDAHERGYAVVGGSIDARSGLRRSQPPALAPWRPGTGRIPSFAHPLLCPSLIPGSQPSWEWDWVEGLPALRAPASEPWLYDGRIALRARPRSGRPRA